PWQEREKGLPEPGIGNHVRKAERGRRRGRLIERRIDHDLDRAPPALGRKTCQRRDSVLQHEQEAGPEGCNIRAEPDLHLKPRSNREDRRTAQSPPRWRALPREYRRRRVRRRWRQSIWPPGSLLGRRPVRVSGRCAL